MHRKVLAVLERGSGDRMRSNLQIEISTLTMLRYAALAGFGFTIGILGAAEVVWILWALVQAAKGVLA